MKPRFILPLLLLALTPLAHAQTSTYYLPPGVTNIRAIITGGVMSPGSPSATVQNFCASNRVGLAQLASDLPAIATATGHPEIAHAPVVLSGNSAAGEGAVATAIANPTNVIAIVATHGAMLATGNDGFNVNRGGDTPGDIYTINAAAVAGVPQVHTFDNGDGFVSPVTLQGWVEYGRSLGAPWHFLIHNDGNHTDHTIALQTDILPWLAAIMNLRLPASAGTGDGTVTLIPIVETNGWLGNIQTKSIASFASYAGDKAKANWFPNQSVATAWSGYHFAPPYTIPAQPIVAPSGIIADLTVLDPNNNDTTSGVGWRINSNFKEADQMNNNIKWWVWGTPPPSIAGLDWIRPIISGKKYNDYTVDPIATFRVTAAADVFIAHADSVVTKPAWLTNYVDTGENLNVSAGGLNSPTVMSVFKKSFAANSTVTLGANGSTGGAFYLTFVKAQGAVLPSVNVNATTPNATEGGANGAFTVTRTGATTNALTVKFSISGTAANGVRYTALGTNVVIPIGQSSATLTVATINNAAQQPTETVVLTLVTNAAYNLGSPASATVNILDDDSPPLPVVSVLASNPNAAEPNVAGAFQFTRTGSTTNALTIYFNLSGTATVGVDYANPGTNLVIAIGQTNATLAITPLDDALVEGTETVTLALNASTNYAFGVTTIDTVNLADNDTVNSNLPNVTVTAGDATAAESSGAASTGTITITRDGSTTNALTIFYACSGAASNGVDYIALPGSVTIAVGKTSTNLTIAPIDDALVEGAEIAVVSALPNAAYNVGSPSFASVLISDNDNAVPLGTNGIIFVTHTNGNNTRDVKLNVYLPATGSGPWPVVIYFPGGGWSVQTETSITPLFQNFTASGYAVISANYITSSFEKWPAQIRDAKAAVRWVRANAATYGFDTNRIGVTGGSSGGHIASFVGVSGGVKTVRVGTNFFDLVSTTGGNLGQSDVVQAVAPMFPPTDLLAMDHYPTPGVADHDAANSPESGLIGAAIQTVPEKTATINPIIYVRAGLPPFWITQGTADALVDFNQSELLNAALVRAQQPVAFWPVQGGGHGPGVSDSQEVIGLMKNFFDRVLKGMTNNVLPVPRFTERHDRRCAAHREFRRQHVF